MKNFWKFLNLEIFCCQPMKNVGKLAVCCCFRGFQLVVSLLFAVPRYQKWRKTNCFAAIFKLLRWFSPILKNFSNFEKFQTFFRKFSDFFSENFQKFLKKIWKFSWKFLKISESRNFLLPANEKCRKTSCLLLFSRFSASCFFTFCSSQAPKRTVLLLISTFALVFSNFEKFQSFFRKFSEIFQKIFRNFWKKSENFLKNFWKFLNLEIFCCQPMKNVGKLAVCCCFRGFQLVVSLLFAVPRYQKWRKTNCFAAIFKLLRWFSPILKKNRHFSENFQKFLKKIWKFSEKFLKISESRNFLLPANEKCRKTSCLLLFSRFSASCFFTFCSSQVPKVEENELFCCYFQTFALVFSNFEKFQTFFRKFSDFFQKIFKNFWKNLKIFWKFLNLEIFCCQPMKNVGKLAVCCCFRGFQLVVSLLFAIPRYQKWRKTNCFAAIFKLLRWFSPILKNFRHFSENFQKNFWNFWKKSQKILKNFWI